MAVAHLNKHQIKSAGAVYTPAWVAQEMIKLSPISWPSALISDPACGDGAFLVALARHLAVVHADLPPKKRSQQIAKQLHGFDLDALALALAKTALDNLFKSLGLPLPTWSLHHLDTTHPAALLPWRGRFDLVIGNPPYVRIQALGPRRRAQIKKHWPLASVGASDLYLAFFEVATKLLAPNGVLAYITPNSYLHSQAGTPLRAMLATTTTLLHLVNFKKHQVFPGAITYAAITVARLAPPAPTHRLAYYEGTATGLGVPALVAQHTLPLLGAKWELATPAAQTTLDAINPGGPTLDSVARISTGLATLADAFYVFKIPGLKSTTRLATVQTKNGRPIKIETALLRPILKASILKPGQATQNLWILFPYKKIKGKNQIIPPQELKKRYPRAWAYLCSIRPALDARDKGRPSPVAWYAFGRSQGLDHTFGPKIITAPMSLAPNFIYRPESDTTFYSGYSLTPSDPRLLPKLLKALNTKDMALYIAHTSKDYQGGWKSYAKGFIKNFRLPSDWDR